MSEYCLKPILHAFLNQSARLSILVPSAKFEPGNKDWRLCLPNVNEVQDVSQLLLI